MLYLDEVVQEFIQDIGRKFYNEVSAIDALLNEVVGQELEDVLLTIENSDPVDAISPETQPSCIYLRASHYGGGGGHSNNLTENSSTSYKIQEVVLMPSCKSSLQAKGLLFQGSDRSCASDASAPSQDNSECDNDAEEEEEEEEEDDEGVQGGDDDSDQEDRDRDKSVIVRRPTKQVWQVWPPLLTFTCTIEVVICKSFHILAKFERLRQRQ